MTDRPESPPVYLSSIALEPNRWKKAEKRRPSLRVSEWSARAAEAGFAGWELWEHHYHLADEKEKKALTGDSLLAVGVFNTYLRPGIDPDEDWEAVAKIVDAFGPALRGLKFNLGNAEKAPMEAQVDAALHWAEALPPRVRMWCECHGGTVLEEPEAAAAAFARWSEDRFAAILHPLGGGSDHCVRWMDALGGRIEHLHWQARGDDGRCSLEEKRDDAAKALRTLQTLGFDGSHSIEFVKGTGQPDETVEGDFAAAAKDLATLREILGRS